MRVVYVQINEEGVVASWRNVYIDSRGLERPWPENSLTNDPIQEIRHNVPIGCVLERGNYNQIIGLRTPHCEFVPFQGYPAPLVPLIQHLI